jgi:hypothetical protein
MFIVQGLSRLIGDPEEARTFEEDYDRLFHQTDGMYWNMYMDRLSDPSVTIHTHCWRAQEDSEAFGVSPEFQAMRRRTVPGGRTAPLPEVELSPGYWSPSGEFTFAAPPTGYDPATLGVAHQSILYVIPGKEMDYVAAEEEIGKRLASIDDVYWFRYFHSLGYPNTYSRVIHWRGKAAAERGMEALGELETVRKALIKDEQGDLCRVKIFSSWPERRARDGV